VRIHARFATALHRWLVFAVVATVNVAVVLLSLEVPVAAMPVIAAAVVALEATLPRLAFVVAFCRSFGL
jgi:hypothetical protein